MSVTTPTSSARISLIVVTWSSFGSGWASSAGPEGPAPTEDHGIGSVSVR